MPSYRLYRNYLRNRRENFQLSFYIDKGDSNILLGIGGNEKKYEFGTISSPFQKFKFFVYYQETFKMEVKEQVSKPIEFVKEYFDVNETRNRSKSIKLIQKKEETPQKLDPKFSSLPNNQYIHTNIQNIPTKERIIQKSPIITDHFSPPFSKNIETESPVSQPSSLNSPPFDSAMGKYFSQGSGSNKKSFKLRFSPFIDERAITTPPQKIPSPSPVNSIEKNDTPPSIPSVVIPKKEEEKNIEIPLFFQTNISSSIYSSENEKYNLDDSGLAFGGPKSDTEDDEFGNLLQNVENPPKLSLFGEDSQFNLDMKNIIFLLSQVKE